MYIKYLSAWPGGMPLQGKVCLVTGGTSGTGVATVVALANKGAQVAAVSRTAATPTHNKSFGVLWNVATLGTNIRFLQTDVADPGACRKCVDQVIKDFGRLDVLVHSAGGAVPGGLYEVTDESWMNAFAVHVHSVFQLSRAAAPHMARQGARAIILLGSAGGLRGCLGALAYGVSEGGTATVRTQSRPGTCRSAYPRQLRLSRNHSHSLSGLPHT